jgi:hypothetical protein
VLIRNGLARGRVGELAAPMDAARNARPMRVGRPIWLRPQIATVLVPIGLIVALFLITVTTPTSDLQAPSDNQCVAIDRFQDNMTGIGASAHVVDCGLPHDGRIRMSDTPVNGDCTQYGDWTLLIHNGIYCVIRS